jgi:hypothetical protein
LVEGPLSAVLGPWGAAFLRVLGFFDPEPRFSFPEVFPRFDLGCGGPDTSTTMTAMRSRKLAGNNSRNIRSISPADFGLASPPGGAGIREGRFSPNQNTP